MAAKKGTNSAICQRTRLSLALAGADMGVLPWEAPTKVSDEPAKSSVKWSSYAPLPDLEAPLPGPGAGSTTYALRPAPAARARRGPARVDVRDGHLRAGVGGGWLPVPRHRRLGELARHRHPLHRRLLPAGPQPALRAGAGLALRAQAPAAGAGLCAGGAHRAACAQLDRSAARRAAERRATHLLG